MMDTGNGFNVFMDRKPDAVGYKGGWGPNDRVPQGGSKLK